MSSPGSASALLAGLLLGGSLIIAIGAQNAFVLRQGLRREHVGIVVAICAVLDALLIVIGVSGVAATLGSHPRALQALALVGALFLLAYGLAAARRALSPRALAVAASGQPASRRSVVLQTLAITLLNPHVYLDTMLLVGAVGAQQPAPWRPAFVIGAALASAGWFVGLGFGARLLAPCFARPMAWRVLDALVAMTMLLIAAGLFAQALRLR
jgi:L-lysine exporter family protein LysE/ArgO